MRVANVTRRALLLESGCDPIGCDSGTQGVKLLTRLPAGVLLVVQPLKLNAHTSYRCTFLAVLIIDRGSRVGLATINNSLDSRERRNDNTHHSITGREMVHFKVC